MTKSVFHPDYTSFLTQIKQRILQARTVAAREVTHELILLYWDIGRSILGKQQTAGWGDSVVERLAADLQSEFPDMRGFSVANIWRMRQLYEYYSGNEFLAHAARELDLCLTRDNHGKILAQVARELLASIPWWHHVELLAKVKHPAARLYYIRATAKLGWSRNVLLNQIKAGAYERAVKEKKTHNFPLALPEHFAEQADEMMKSRYNLEFLGINRAVKERELEDRLVSHLQRFILELGYGFCFVGRQYRLTLGAKEYFVDLLF